MLGLAGGTGNRRNDPADRIDQDNRVKATIKVPFHEFDIGCGEIRHRQGALKAPSVAKSLRQDSLTVPTRDATNRSDNRQVQFGLGHRATRLTVPDDRP